MKTRIFMVFQGFRGFHGFPWFSRFGHCEKCFWIVSRPFWTRWVRFGAKIGTFRGDSGQMTIMEQFGVHRFCDLKSQQTWQIWEKLKSMKIQYFDENPGFLVKSVFSWNMCWQCVVWMWKPLATWHFAVAFEVFTWSQALTALKYADWGWLWRDQSWLWRKQDSWDLAAKTPPPHTHMRKPGFGT